jgi:hypothetical protein
MRAAVSVVRKTSYWALSLWCLLLRCSYCWHDLAGCSRVATFLVTSSWCRCRRLQELRHGGDAVCLSETRTAMRAISLS